MGESSRLCEESLEWAGSAPECVLDECPALEAPENGSVDHPSRAPGEAATYECDEGHSLVGESSRLCEESLEWAGSAPECVLDECPALEAPENGSVDHASRVPGASALYACDEGYELAGESSRLCEESLEWAGFAPKCFVPHSCASPGASVSTSVIGSLVIPGDNEVFGFNLDDHHTTSDSDPVGCGQIDQAGGVDNGFAKFLSFVEEVFAFGFNPQIANAIAGGSIWVVVEMKGYDGPDDEFVVLSLFSGGAPIEGAQDLCVASRPDGSLRVGFPTLSLTIPEAYTEGMDTFPLTITMTEVLLEIDNPAATPSSAVLGGVVRWGNGESLHTELQAIVDAAIGAFDIDTIAQLFLDLGPPGECDSFGFGMHATLSPIIQ